MGKLYQHDYDISTILKPYYIETQDKLSDESDKDDFSML